MSGGELSGFAIANVKLGRTGCVEAMGIMKNAQLYSGHRHVSKLSGTKRTGHLQRRSKQFGMNATA
jgi:hypothetical protein